MGKQQANEKLPLSSSNYKSDLPKSPFDKELVQGSIGIYLCFTTTNVCFQRLLDSSSKIDNENHKNDEGNKSQNAEYTPTTQATKSCLRLHGDPAHIWPHCRCNIFTDCICVGMQPLIPVVPCHGHIITYVFS